MYKRLFLCFYVILLFIIACKEEVITNSNLFHVKLSADSIVANNYSYLEITVSADSNTIPAKREVKFETTKGVFSNGSNAYTTSIDVSGKAYAYLKSDKSEPALVKVTMALNTKQVTVRFTTAWPDFLNVDVPASASNALSSKVTVSVQSGRNTGSVTPGIPVQFLARDTANKPVGTFMNLRPIGSDGKASAEFWLQDTTYKGFVNITGFVVRKPTDTVKGVNRVLFVK